MKFCVKNDLSIFEFHDSEFSFVSYDGTDLVVSASMVNIHKDTPQNTSDHDLEITSAQITFKNFHSPTYEPGRVWEMGEDGKSYPVGPQVIFREKDAIDRILEELQKRLRFIILKKKIMVILLVAVVLNPTSQWNSILIMLLSVGTNTRKKRGMNCIGNIGMMLCCRLQMAM